MDRRLANSELGDFVLDRLRVLLERVSAEWRACAANPDSAAVHDLRVSLRRFGETVRLFKTTLPKPARRQVRAELRQVMSLAGKARDVDIVRENFASAEVAVSPELDLFLQNERAVAQAALAAALATGVGTLFEDRWSRSLCAKPNQAGSTQLPAAAGDGWQAHHSTAMNARSVLPVFLAGYCSHGDKLIAGDVKPARLHELRLQGKHLRYGLEVFRPIYGRKMDELLTNLKDSQSDLGNISDCTASLAWLRAHNVHRWPESRQLRIYLEHRAERRAAHFVEYWRNHWGLSPFRDRWISYLRRYAGRMPVVRQAVHTGSDNNGQPAIAAILSQAADMSDNGVSEPYSGVMNPR